MSESFTGTTVGDIVVRDFRAGAVFEDFGIDFCCGGRRSVAEACRQAAVDPATVERALSALPATAPSEADDVTQWPVGRLIDYIVTTHHTYVRTALPVINRYLAKLVDVHCQRHPELERAAAAFSLLSSDLNFHMLKEEHVLFPYLRELGRGHTLSSPFGSVENPISMMEREH